MPILSAKKLCKSYGKLQVLKDVSLEIEQGEIVAIVGPSGTGKTTLLQILGTLDKADKGEIKIKHTNVSQMTDKTLSTFRNQNIGFVFQFHHLLPEFTALENVCLPAYIGHYNKKQAEQRAMDLLTILGLKDRAKHKPAELSGGEQQRVAVARALINKPAIIFADEPSGNLDSHSAKELHQLFFDLRQNFNQTFVIVTHNQELAIMADRIIEMADGRIIENKGE